MKKYFIVLIILIIALIAIASVPKNSINGNTDTVTNTNTNMKQTPKTINSSEISDVSKIDSLMKLTLTYYSTVYNKTLHIYAECPYSSTYYLESDNFLADIALRYLNQSPQINFYGKVSLSPYLPLDGIHNFTWKFHDPSLEILNGNVVTCSFSNSSMPYLSWYEYADTSFLYSIYEVENGNLTLAEQAFSDGMNFWNGYGFMDDSYNGKYSSYKLALAIIAWKYINSTNSSFASSFEPEMSEIYNISYHLQSSIGGFFTCYEVFNGHVIPEGNVNTETTSLFVIAFLMKSGDPIYVKM